MQRFKNILCVMAPDTEGGPALARAAALANSNQARLSVVEVFEDPPVWGRLPKSGLSDTELQAGHKAARLQVLAEQVEALNTGIDADTEVLSGTPFLAIIRAVLEREYDLVIKAPSNGGLLDRLFGSDDMHLLRKCPCPVWLVKPQAARAYRRIVAPVDVDDFYPPDEVAIRHELNAQILEMASALTLSEFASLHIVVVWRARYESALQGGFMNMPEDKVDAYVQEVRQQCEENLEKLMAEVAAKVGQALSYIKPQVHIIKGWPREEIPAFAENIEADLVVMGTVARTGIPGVFMGNTAETVLNRLGCSVLAVKPAGFVSPITL